MGHGKWTNSTWITCDTLSSEIRLDEDGARIVIKVKGEDGKHYDITPDVVTTEIDVLMKSFLKALCNLWPEYGFRFRARGLTIIEVQIVDHPNSHAEVLHTQFSSMNTVTPPVLPGPPAVA
jgi:hypothetical protein